MFQGKADGDVGLTLIASEAGLFARNQDSVILIERGCRKQIRSRQNRKWRTACQKFERECACR
jgi:hypothetical protein